MFRTKEEREEQYKTKGGRKSKSNWFRDDKEKTTTTTTVPTTSGGLLAKQMQTTLESCPAPGRCRTKVLEGGGVTVKQNIVRSNPFPRQSCGRPDCILDQTSDKGCRERCFKEGVGYSSRCTRCRAAGQHVDGRPPDRPVNYTYSGETARTIYTRSKQHLANYKSHRAGRKAVESWMWEHTVSHHGGVVGPDQGQGDYEFRIEGVFQKPLQRQVDEAVRLGQIDSHGCLIEDVGGEWGSPVVSLNTRGEFFKPRIMQYNFQN